MTLDPSTRRSVIAALQLIRRWDAGQQAWLQQLVSPLPPSLMPDAAAVRQLVSVAEFDPVAELAAAIDARDEVPAHSAGVGIGGRRAAGAQPSRPAARGQRAERLRHPAPKVGTAPEASAIRDVAKNALDLAKRPTTPVDAPPRADLAQGESQRAGHEARPDTRARSGNAPASKTAHASGGARGKQAPPSLAERRRKLARQRFASPTIRRADSAPRRNSVEPAHPDGGGAHDANDDAGRGRRMQRWLDDMLTSTPPAAAWLGGRAGEVARGAARGKERSHAQRRGQSSNQTSGQSKAQDGGQHDTQRNTRRRNDAPPVTSRAGAGVDIPELEVKTEAPPPTNSPPPGEPSLATATDLAEALIAAADRHGVDLT